MENRWENSLKVTLLTTLADEGGLHLLCPHRCSAVQDQTKEASCPSLELSEQLVDLLVKGCFRKARQSDSEAFEWMISTLKKTYSPEGAARQFTSCITVIPS